MTKRRGYRVRDHRHAYHRAKCVDIGPTTCLQPISHSSAPAGVVLNTPEADAYGTHLGGYIFGHERDWPHAWRCEGFVSIDTCATSGDRVRWETSGSLEGGDLTLTPSVLCLSPLDGVECGFHGYIRSGAWVPA